MRVPNCWVLFFRVGCISLVGGVGGLNQNSVRGISVYSSFVHSSWIVAGLLCSFNVFLAYFILYCWSLFFFFYRCELLGKSNLKSASISWVGFLGLLILRGLPPFLGFVGKFIVVVRCPRFLLVFCIVGSGLRLKYYTSFMYRMVINRRGKNRVLFDSVGAIFVSLSVFNFFSGVFCLCLLMF